MDFQGSIWGDQVFSFQGKLNFSEWIGRSKLGSHGSVKDVSASFLIAAHLQASVSVRKSKHADSPLLHSHDFLDHGRPRGRLLAGRNGDTRSSLGWCDCSWYRESCHGCALARCPFLALLGFRRQKTPAEIIRVLHARERSTIQFHVVFPLPLPSSLG